MHDDPQPGQVAASVIESDALRRFREFVERWDGAGGGGTLPPDVRLEAEELACAVEAEIDDMRAEIAKSTELERIARLMWDGDESPLREKLEETIRGVAREAVTWPGMSSEKQAALKRWMDEQLSQAARISSEIVERLERERAQASLRGLVLALRGISSTRPPQREPAARRPPVTRPAAAARRRRPVRRCASPSRGDPEPEPPAGCQSRRRLVLRRSSGRSLTGYLRIGAETWAEPGAAIGRPISVTTRGSS
jgi:hypothetical protein